MLKTNADVVWQSQIQGQDLPFSALASPTYPYIHVPQLSVILMVSISVLSSLKLRFPTSCMEKIEAD